MHSECIAKGRAAREFPVSHLCPDIALEFAQGVHPQAAFCLDGVSDPRAGHVRLGRGAFGQCRRRCQPLDRLCRRGDQYHGLEPWACHVPYQRHGAAALDSAAPDAGHRHHSERGDRGAGTGICIADPAPLRQLFGQRAAGAHRRLRDRFWRRDLPCGKPRPRPA